MNDKALRVGIVMGSDSDWPKINKVGAALEQFGVGYEVRVMSAHRTPEIVAEYATTAEQRWRLTGMEDSLVVAFKRAKAENKPVYYFSADGVLDSGNC